MPKGELFINGKDAFEEWGISLSSNGLSALMCPAPNKELIENKSRLEHGKRVVSQNARIDEREISIPFHLTAKDKADFLERYASFCSVLANGVLDIRTEYQPYTTYHTNYISCSQFSEFRLGLAKFMLRVNEPNPNYRE